ncbi:hypothetical protein NHB34_01560 [Polynucleobacter sp. MWH-UH19D]|uniref:hypothetical protein n=1 Tax=Polynucleobacter sp. MWH-UH19D TaxID=1855610 RepID=UPI00336502D7
MIESNEINMLRLLIIGLTALVSLTACEGMSTINWDPAKNNPTSFRKDLKECQEDYPIQNSGVHAKQWIGCMN